MIRSLAQLSLLLAAAALAPDALSPRAGRRQRRQRGRRQLRALHEGYSTGSPKSPGSFEDAKGESQQAGYLPRVDAASNRRRAAHMQALLGQLDAIPAAQLSPDERTNAAVLRTILEAGISDARFREWEMPVNSDSNFWTYLDQPNTLDSADAYRRYIEGCAICRAISTSMSPTCAPG